jgi:hypothetical protein
LREEYRLEIYDSLAEETLEIEFLEEELGAAFAALEDESGEEIKPVEEPERIDDSGKQRYGEISHHISEQGEELEKSTKEEIEKSAELFDEVRIPVNEPEKLDGSGRLRNEVTTYQETDLLSGETLRTIEIPDTLDDSGDQVKPVELPPDFETLFGSLDVNESEEQSSEEEIMENYQYDDSDEYDTDEEELTGELTGEFTDEMSEESSDDGCAPTIILKKDYRKRLRTASRRKRMDKKRKGK